MVKFKESESGQYVQYTGVADERRITKKDWKALGIDHPDLVWSADNAKHVPVEDISEDAWPYVDADDGMKLVTVEDPSTLKAESAAGPGASVHPLAAARKAAEATATGGGTTTVASGTGSATTTGGSTAGSGSTPAGTGRGRTT